MHPLALPLLSAVVFTSLTEAHTILDRQCWHEFPLSTAHIFSSQERQKEYTSPIQSPFQIKQDPHAPWTHPPICTPILPSINDVLCIYVSTTFSNGRGIVIFTTPSVAAQYAALPAFTSPSLLTSQSINIPTNTWRATPLPQKGIGMLATRKLSFGDTITAYTPAFLAYLESDLSTLDRETWWRRAINLLLEATRKDFLALSYVYGDERVRVQDIVKANTFQIHVGGANHLAIWPETSRLNHACNPNAQYVIDAELLTHTVRATRDIEVGEEISIAYTSPLEPVGTRQDHLQAGFHFTCTCPRCTAPESDVTLSLIHSLQVNLNDWSDDSVGTPELAEQLLQVHRDEGLEGFMDLAYGFAALAYSAVGDEAGAVKYAEKAKEAILMKDGRWSANLKIWEELLRDVRAHWSWQRRL